MYFQSVRRFVRFWQGECAFIVTCAGAWVVLFYLSGLNVPSVSVAEMIN